MRNNLFLIGLATILLLGCGGSDTAQSDALGGADGATTGGAPPSTGGIGSGATDAGATGGAGAAGPATGGDGATATLTGGAGSGAAPAGGADTGGVSATSTGGATPAGSDTGGAASGVGGTTASGGALTGGVGGDATGGTSGDATGGTSGDATGGTSGDDTGGGGGTGGGGSTDGIDCTRAGLSNAVDAYLAAIQAHDPSLMPGSDQARYTENASEVAVGESLWSTAGDVSYTHSIFDTTKCNTFTFVVSDWVEPGQTDRAPIVMGVRLKVESSKVTEVEAIITRDGDWAFDAAKFQQLAEADGEWPIQDPQQTREEIQYPADCYFDDWTEKIDHEDVPLAPGCLRLEGSMNGPCDMVGTADDDDVGFGDRHYVIDVEKGAVALIGLFGGDFGGLLDVHLFRVVDGLVVRIHTATLYHDPQTVSATGWDPY